MRTITFLASENNHFEEVLHYHKDIKDKIDWGVDDITVSDLSFLSFDLLDKFMWIKLYYWGEYYDLKLGKNDWTVKELRKEHNLLKLVRSNILE